MAWFDENAPTDYQPPAIAGGGYTGMGGSFGVTDPAMKSADPTLPPPDRTAAPSPTPTPGTTPTTSGPQNGDWEGWFNTLFPGESLSPDQLVAKEAEINAAGGKVLRNAAGVAGKIQLPGGEIIDVIQGASSGLNRKQFLRGDASGGGSLGSLGQGFGGMTAPFTGVFSAPTAEQAKLQPGYQFTQDEALNAGQRSAAAKGTLLTGGTLKDLAGYAGGIASQNYNNLFNQQLQSFGVNRDTFYHNQDSPFSKLYQVSALGRPTTP